MTSRFAWPALRPKSAKRRSCAGASSPTRWAPRLSSREAGVDRDLFDPYCEHLIVRDEAAGRIVGTYRILTPQAARRVGSYYSETEFDLTRFHLIRERLVEVGRSCIDPDYRTGATIALLWSGLWPLHAGKRL